MKLRITVLPFLVLLTWSYGVSVLDRGQVEGVVTAPAVKEVIKADWAFYNAGGSANHGNYND